MNTNKPKAFTITELIIVILIAILLITVVLPHISLFNSRTRTVVVGISGVNCAAQLSGIGRALALYQNDYNDSYPITFAPDPPGSFGMGLYNTVNSNQNTRWLDMNFKDWQNQPTTGSCLYLLVKYTDLIPKMFLCPQAPYDQEMHLDNAVQFCTENQMPTPQNWADLNDFQSMRNLSYSYIDPWNNLPNTASPSDLAVLADKNPAYDTETGRINPNFNYAPEDPASGNTLNHDGEWQNILFTDCNVKRETTPQVGIQQDNIYTHWPNQNPTQQQRTTGLYNQGHSATPDDAYLGN